MFGSTTTPEIAIDQPRLQELAREAVVARVAVAGVQPKLSVDLVKIGRDHRSRLTLAVELGGSFILKPPFDLYRHLPEVEDVTMHLAADAGLTVATHTLIRLADGGLAYLTRRFDRPAKGGRLAMEDMAQLMARLTTDKYRGSLEQIGKTLVKYSSADGLDRTEFFQLAIFCFLTGNADMHLKNFSLLTQPDGTVRLSPAYDLVATKLVNPADDEDTALTLNGRKKRLKPADFVALANSLRIPYPAVRNVYAGFQKNVPKWRKRIDRSFLPDELKATYHELLTERLVRLTASE